MISHILYNKFFQSKHYWEWQKIFQIEDKFSTSISLAKSRIINALKSNFYIIKKIYSKILKMEKDKETLSNFKLTTFPSFCVVTKFKKIKKSLLKYKPNLLI